MKTNQYIFWQTTIGGSNAPGANLPLKRRRRVIFGQCITAVHDLRQHYPAEMYAPHKWVLSVHSVVYASVLTEVPELIYTIGENN